MGYYQATASDHLPGCREAAWRATYRLTHRKESLPQTRVDFIPPLSASLRRQRRVCFAIQ